jgi:hypothetical protein
MHVPYLKQLPGWSGKSQKFGLFLVGSSPLLDRDFELNWIKGVLSPNQTLPQTAKTVWDSNTVTTTYHPIRSGYGKPTVLML